MLQLVLAHGYGLSIRLLMCHNLSPELLMLQQLQITGGNVSNGLLCLHPTQHLGAPEGVVLCLRNKAIWKGYKLVFKQYFLIFHQIKPWEFFFKNCTMSVGYRVEEHVAVLSWLQLLLPLLHVHTEFFPALHHLLLQLLQHHLQLRRAHVQNCVSSIQKLLKL